MFGIAERTRIISLPFGARTATLNDSQSPHVIEGIHSHHSDNIETAKIDSCHIVGANAIDFYSNQKLCIAGIEWKNGTVF